MASPQPRSEPSFSPAVATDTLGAVANDVVQVFATRAGKGPRAAKGFLLDESILIVVLRGGLTELEQTLLDDGRDDLVRTTRIALEETLRDVLISRVQERTGRDVIDYHSQVLLKADMIVEVFVLGDIAP